MYAADMALWLLNNLFSAPNSRPYNVGSDVAVTIKDLAHMTSKLKRPEVEVKVMCQGRDEKKDIYVPSIQRARDELGLDLHFRIEEALSLTIQWHLIKTKSTRGEKAEWGESLSAPK
jgi:dTDP-glucose 4,6-dehydratase